MRMDSGYTERDHELPMTDREKQLLQDLVDMSILAQKVLLNGTFRLEFMGEAAILQEMSAHILNTCTVVKDD